MKIKVMGHIIDVAENNLIVKDKKLYNTSTKEFEGVEADLILIEFEKDGKPSGLKGTVGGYTCGSHVVIRPNYEFNNVTKKKIDHISHVELIESNEDELLEIAEME